MHGKNSRNNNNTKRKAPCVVSLEVYPSDSIQDIKSRICIQQGLSFDEQQRLIFNTMELSDSKSAAEAGLKKGSVLHLVRKKN